jgi:hypothetical protein
MILVDAGFARRKLTGCLESVQAKMDYSTMDTPIAANPLQTPDGFAIHHSPIG